MATWPATDGSAFRVARALTLHPRASDLSDGGWCRWTPKIGHLFLDLSANAYKGFQLLPTICPMPCAFRPLLLGSGYHPADLGHWLAGAPRPLSCSRYLEGSPRGEHLKPAPTPFSRVARMMKHPHAIENERIACDEGFKTSRYVIATVPVQILCGDRALGAARRAIVV